MKEKTPSYNRLTYSERKSIEAGLYSRKGCREIARSIERSPSVVNNEIRRNRTWADKSAKGIRVPGDANICDCNHLDRWPWVCNSCFTFPRACGRKKRCEYRAIYAQRISDERASSSRRGLNVRECDFERISFTIRSDISRGLSPEQICMAHPHLSLCPSTLYRWIEKGYFGMSNMDLRRKVGYKPRKTSKRVVSTSHGKDRSYAAFCTLDESVHVNTAEMDTVLGTKQDSKCILTLYIRACHMQIAMLLKEKSAEAVAATLDALENAIGKDTFKVLFGVILTDNGGEFADTKTLERSVFDCKPRTKVYYCDIRASNQKGACEKNHSEIRKFLPKGKGISFDKLDCKDMSCLMSYLNSEPRPSLMGMTPLQMLKAAKPREAKALTDALGIEEIPYEKHEISIKAINDERCKRGLDDLI